MDVDETAIDFMIFFSLAKSCTYLNAKPANVSTTSSSAQMFLALGSHQHCHQKLSHSQRNKFRLTNEQL